MLTFLSGFLVFNLLYHIFITFTVYGLEIFSASFPSLMREALWCCGIALIFLLNIKQRKAYRKIRKKGWLLFGTLLFFSVLISFFLVHKGRSDIFIGIKYGFRRLFILLSATSIGFFYRKKLYGTQIITRLKRMLIITVVGGFLRQGLKLLNPDLFSRIGYELKLDDFHFGEKPPLYYLTGYEGTLRRQGIFSGPNNYGYFLVAFFPLVLLFFGEQIKKRKQFTLFQRINTGIVLLRILAMLMTLSRAVILGGIVICILLYRNTIKKLKKPVLRGILGGGIALIIGLSLRKWESTIGHLTSKLQALPQIISQPLGYGLGTSGPAIHHNGTLLPENYYFQIMLDVGTVGFLLLIGILFQLISIQRKIKQASSEKTLSQEEQALFLIYNRVQVGFLALLIIGLVLHVFEDSMVNYVFFIIYGAILGNLSILGNSSSRHTTQ